MSNSYLIVGARFRPPAQEVLMSLPTGCPLILRRQPDNPYDANAIAVMIEEDFVDAAFNPDGELMFPLHLGFIPREHASILAPKIDLLVGDDLTLPDVPAKLTFSASGGPMAMIVEKAE